MGFAVKYLAFLFALLVALPAMAQPQNGAAVEIPNIAYFATTSLGAYVHVQGVAKPGDGGDSYWQRNGLTCSVDGTTIVKDKGGNCFFKQAGNTPVHAPIDITTCGVTSAAADNTTALQACENLANSTGVNALYCPPGSYTFLSSVTTFPNMRHIGAGIDTCTFHYNPATNIPGWKLLLPNGTETINAPSFSHMTVYLDGFGSFLQLNSPTGGFTDTAASQQYMVFGDNALIDGVHVIGSQRDYACIQFNKVFHAVIRNSEFFFCDYALDLEGSDNILSEHNLYTSQLKTELYLQQQGTFGNFFVSAYDIFYPPYATGGAYSFMELNYRGATFISPYFEENTPLTDSIIKITGGVNYSFIDPEFEVFGPASGGPPCFFNVTSASVKQIQITGAKDASVAPFPSCFPGNGFAYIDSSFSRHKLFLRGNVSSFGGGFPFVTQDDLPLDKTFLTGLSGSMIAKFTPDTAGPCGGALYPNNVFVASEEFIFPPNLGVGGRIQFCLQTGGYTGTVDYYVCGQAGANGQTGTLLDNVGNSYTITMNLAYGCQRATGAGGVAVAGLSSVTFGDGVSNASYIAEIDVRVH
jgi:hypothetical protein